MGLDYMLGDSGHPAVVQKTAPESKRYEVAGKHDRDRLDKCCKRRIMVVVVVVVVIVIVAVVATILLVVVAY